MNPRSPFQLLATANAKDLSSTLLDGNKMKLFHAEHFKKMEWIDLRLFCHNYARYGIPTVELIEFLKSEIAGRSCIEIGAGCGDLGFHLGVKMTDSWQQADPQVKKVYESMKQPIIQYPPDVEKIEALDAVIKYKPEVVIASWITPYSDREEKWGSNPQGIKEPQILDLVETFIIIGNMNIHWDKPIRQLYHKAVIEPWIVSRAKDQSQNCIYIWDKK